MLSFVIIDELLGYDSFLHKQFNLMSKISLLINIILITFTYQVPINNPVKAFLVFDGGVLFTSLSVLISGVRRGLFK